ncbi:IclR family transcriptional regulator [Actinocorallia herbida]|nr:IclR family transcriptional regulator [Actinocorallia herbida]
MTGSAGGYRERNSTADRALDVLLLFSEEQRTLSGSEVAQHLGVARSTGYRYLQSLTASGFVEEVDGRYGLGPKILELARVARSGSGLLELARPVMSRLAERTEQTVLLTRRSGNVVVCLDAVESTRPIRISYEPGHVFALNAGAAAEVLLAWEDDATVAELLATATLERYTERSVTDPEVLAARLRRIRASGAAVSRGEVDAEVLGIAAPVFDGNGRVRAAISVAALARQHPAGSAELLEEGVRSAAKDLTLRLSLG